MQEDNWSKRLAESLKKEQEDNPLPYEEGAWEIFNKKKYTTKPLHWYYWSSGIAASIVMGIVLLNSLSTDPLYPEVQNSPEEMAGNNKKESHQDPFSDNITFRIEQKDSLVIQRIENLNVRAPKSNSLTLQQMGLVKNGISLSTDFYSNDMESLSSNLSENHSKDSIFNSADQSFFGRIVSSESSSLKNNTIYLTEEEALAKIRIQMQEGPLEVESSKQMASSLFLELGSGFWNTSQNDISTSGSNISLGLKYDLNVGTNISLGSGLGVNYLNLTNQSEQNFRIAGFSTPIIELQQVQQIQMDVPVYMRYAINTSKSVSIQAGFSNLFTFNQQAIQTVSSSRQVSGTDGMNAMSGTPTLKVEQLSQTSALNIPSNRFFPFASANLGMNILVYTNQKTNFLLMPFYQYPLQDISGTGKNPGVTGAALRMKFGALKK
jgi:hypothetical protein